MRRNGSGCEEFMIKHTEMGLFGENLLDYKAAAVWKNRKGTSDTALVDMAQFGLSYVNSDIQVPSCPLICHSHLKLTLKIRCVANNYSTI